MRCVIARYPFDLTKNGVMNSMEGITPEPVTGESVTIGRRRYPVKQVGEIITRQDRRDFSSGEVVRAMTRLGFTCHARPEATPAVAPSQPWITSEPLTSEPLTSEPLTSEPLTSEPLTSEPLGSEAAHPEA